MPSIVIGIFPAALSTVEISGTNVVAEAELFNKKEEQWCFENGVKWINPWQQFGGGVYWHDGVMGDVALPFRGSRATEMVNGKISCKTSSCVANTNCILVR